MQNAQKNKSSTEFDFILRSVWLAMVDCIDIFLADIFSPADPDVFHRRYLASFEFLERFEQKCAQFDDKDLKARLQQTQSYKFFVKKWPIQVYFQIRFQEIVSHIEEELCDYKSALVKLDDTLDAKDENELTDKNQNMFNLKVTKAVVGQMEYCWSESNCFLVALLSQFWKLNLQIISRYSTFFMRIYQEKVNCLDTKVNQAGDQFTHLQIQEQSIATTKARSKTPDGNEASLMSNQNTDMSQQATTDDITFSVLLLLDINKLASIKLPNLFDGIISPVVRSANAMKDISSLKEAFAVSLASLGEVQAVVNDFIVKKLIEDVSECLKNVNDIARLYRRTNREVCSVFYSSPIHF